jgi:hypothetical protein
MKHTTTRQQIVTAQHINPVINEFISEHIPAWIDFCDYHFQKQESIYQVCTKGDHNFDVLGFSIDSMLQMKESIIICLLLEKSGTAGYSMLNIWMLRQIKQRIYAIYSGNQQIDLESEN